MMGSLRRTRSFCRTGTGKPALGSGGSFRRTVYRAVSRTLAMEGCRISVTQTNLQLREGEGYFVLWSNAEDKPSQLRPRVSNPYSSTFAFKRQGYKSPGCASPGSDQSISIQYTVLSTDHASHRMASAEDQKASALHQT